MAAIVIEDGSVVAGANSFISIDGARSYALDRGTELPTDDDEVAAMLIRASDYLIGKGSEFKGRKVSPLQSLPFPRSGIEIDGYCVPSDSIPVALISAQCQLVMAVADGLTLQPNITAQDYVIEETVDVITTKYASPVQAGVMPVFSAVDALLAPFISDGCCGDGGLGLGINTVRV